MVQGTLAGNGGSRTHGGATQCVNQTQCVCHHLPSLTSWQAPLSLSSSASFLGEQQPDVTHLLMARQMGAAPWGLSVP